MSRTKQLVVALLVAALFCGAAVQTASACPNCKETVAVSSGDGSSGPGATAGTPTGGLPAGFNLSIYVMLAAFFAVLGFVGFTLYRAANPTARRGFPVVGTRPQ